MKTFLEICQDVREETGISGSGPVSVTTAIGIERRIVGWVRQAWVDVQQFRPDWPWMVKDFTFNLSPEKERYTLAELNLTDVDRWIFDQTRIYKTADGRLGESYIRSADYYRDWLSLTIGITENTTPTHILFNPTNNELVFFPAPDAEYTTTTRYYRQPQRVAADIDIPLVPPGARFQEIIKWKALMYYGFHDGAPDVLGEAEQMYAEMITAMDNQFGQNITIGHRPLA